VCRGRARSLKTALPATPTPYEVLRPCAPAAFRTQLPAHLPVLQRVRQELTPVAALRVLLVFVFHDRPRDVDTMQLV
jgi:hypothetical protein